MLQTGCPTNISRSQSTQRLSRYFCVWNRNFIRPRNDGVFSPLSTVGEDRETDRASDQNHNTDLRLLMFGSNKVVTQIVR